MTIRLSNPQSYKVPVPTPRTTKCECGYVYRVTLWNCPACFRKHD